MLLVRPGTAQVAKAVGIISPYVALPGNANLPIGDTQTANREIGVPGTLLMRSLQSMRRCLSTAPSKSTAIPSICSR